MMEILKAINADNLHWTIDRDDELRYVVLRDGRIEATISEESVRIIYNLLFGGGA